MKIAVPAVPMTAPHCTVLQRALMSVRIIDRHELHTGIHQGRYELDSIG